MEDPIDIEMTPFVVCADLPVDGLYPVLRYGTMPQQGFSQAAPGEIMFLIDVPLPDYAESDDEYATVAWDDVADAFVPRPVLAKPSETLPQGQAAPWAYDITGLPVGTGLTVWTANGEAIPILDFSTPLTFETFGWYRIRAEPPFPYIGFTEEFTLA